MKRFLFSISFISLSLLGISQTISKKEVMYLKCEKLFYTNQFEESIKLGEQIIKQSRVDKSFKYETIELVAKSYRAKNDNYNAERWARILSNAVKTEYARILYLHTLISNEKYEDAYELAEKWTLETKNDTVFSKIIISIDSAIAWFYHPHSMYNIRKLDEINSLNRDFSPVHIDDTLIFCTDRNGATDIGNLNLYRIPLDINKDSLEIKNLQIWDDINSKKHNGPAAILKNDSTYRIYFTQAISNGFIYEREKLNLLQIFYIDFDNGKWTKPKSFFPVNNDLFSSAHPAIGEIPNRIYFVSDNKNGFGGMDIYYTEFNNGLWTSPVNLGPEINTSGNELFPYVDDNTLYFSSDGHPGMGRLDIFSAYKNEKDNWSNVTNLQPPVNSKFDDFGFSTWTNPDNAFFSSNRNKNSYNDDIYVASRNKIETLYFIGQDVELISHKFFDHISFSIQNQGIDVPLNQTKNIFSFNPKKEQEYIISYNLRSFKENEVTFKNTLKSTKTEIFRAEILTKSKPIYIIGVLKRGEFPVANHKILVLKNGIPLDTILTDLEGNYKYKIPKNEHYELLALTKAGEDFFEQKEFVEVNIKLLSNLDNSPLLNTAINTLINDNKHKAFTTNLNGEIYFTAKAKDVIGINIDKKGYFSIDTTLSLVFENKLIYNYIFYLEKRKDFLFNALVVDDKNQPISNATVDIINNNNVINKVQSDANGDFNPTLFQGEKYSFIITKSGYFQLDSTLVVDDNKDTVIFMLQNIQHEVDIKLDNIYFDFNSYILSESSKQTLLNLATFLEENPTKLIQVSSHTDQRGENAFNLELSQKRADEIKQFLIKNGINEARLYSLGYGEEVPLIVEAKTEEEHEQNRRSQFKIIGSVDFTDFHPEKIITTNDLQYFIKLAVEKHPLPNDHILLKTYPEILKALNGKDIVYFIGPFDRKTQLELENKKLKKIDFQYIQILKYKNKIELY